MKIVRIYLSPDHNFVGHHGKPPGETPAEKVDKVECVAGSGLRGDRYFDHREDYKGQVSFFAEEVHHRICEQFGRSPDDIDASVYRRNVITRGIDLNTLIEKEFEIQGVRFRGTEECSPCYWMNSAFGPEAEEALKGNGGLRARILSDGELRVDADADSKDL
jgi:MOSC domain-containing protein YiiM